MLAAYPFSTVDGKDSDNAIILLMHRIIRKVLLDIQVYHDAGGKAQRKAGDLYKGIDFLIKQVPDTCHEVALKHACQGLKKALVNLDATRKSNELRAETWGVR